MSTFSNTLDIPTHMHLDNTYAVSIMHITLYYTNNDFTVEKTLMAGIIYNSVSLMYFWLSFAQPHSQFDRTDWFSFTVHIFVLFKLH